MGPGILFSKRKQIFQKKRKKCYLQSSAVFAMQAFNTSPGNSHIEADDVQLKELYIKAVGIFSLCEVMGP